MIGIVLVFLLFNLAVDNESGCVYVADRENDRIQVFDLQGNFLRVLDGKLDNKALNKPAGVSVSDFYTYSDTGCTVTRALFIADRNNDRVQIFSTSGAWLAQITGLYKPEDVFTDEYGIIHIANTNTDSIGVYSTTLERTLVISEFNHPKGIYSDRYIYVADSNNNRVCKYNKYGERVMQFLGTDTITFNKPIGLTADKQGNLYIVDRENNRIVKVGAPVVDETMAMRMFSLPKAAMSIKDAYAYPIPFKPNSGLGHTAISFKLYSTLNVLLRIYNIAGEMIFEQTGITVDPYIWSVVNNWGEPVTSGVYIYFLTDDTKERKIGKIMIIR